MAVGERGTGMTYKDRLRLELPIAKTAIRKLPTGSEQQGHSYIIYRIGGETSLISADLARQLLEQYPQSVEEIFPKQE